MEPCKERAPYLSGKHIGPDNINIATNEEGEFILADQKIIQLICVKSRISSITSCIPSWTGFNIQIRNDIPILKSTKGT